MGEPRLLVIETIDLLSVDLYVECQLYREAKNDSFTAFLSEIIELFGVRISLINNEHPKSSIDASTLLKDLIRNRDRFTHHDQGEIVRESPYTAVCSARHSLGWNDEEYMSAVAFMAHLCGKLAIRHHLRNNYDKAAMFAMDALFCSDELCEFLPISMLGAREQKFIAIRAVKKRLENDPKQLEKSYVFQCWHDWQKSKTPEIPKGNYKSKAAFAKDMLSKYENLESSAVIERWCREWEKSHSTG